MAGQNLNQTNFVLLNQIKSAFDTSEFSDKFRSDCSNLLDFIEDSENIFLNNHIHPLGFYTLKISEWEDGTSLKIHIWSNTKRPEKSRMTIHKHNSSLKSYILCGNIKNIEYDLLESSQNKEYNVYNCIINNGERTLIKSDVGGKLNVLDNHDYFSGQIYKIRGEFYHESIVKKGNFTATLIYSYGNDSPTVIGKTKSRIEVKTAKKVCELDLMKKLIQKVNQKHKELTVL